MAEKTFIEIFNIKVYMLSPANVGCNWGYCAYNEEDVPPS